LLDDGLSTDQVIALRYTFDLEVYC